MPLQSGAAGGCERVPSHRFFIEKFFASADITGVFQLLELRTEISIGHCELLFECGEADLVIARQQGTDCKTCTVFESRIQTFERDHASDLCAPLAIAAMTNATAMMPPTAVHI